MRLTDLEPEYRVLSIVTGSVGSRRVQSLAEADGIQFLCPTCFIKNHGSVGTHGIQCWRPKIPLMSDLPGPGRWEFGGTDFTNLTLIAHPNRSVKLTGGCNAHFHITDGEIQFV